MFVSLCFLNGWQEVKILQGVVGEEKALPHADTAFVPHGMNKSVLKIIQILYIF